MLKEWLIPAVISSSLFFTSNTLSKEILEIDMADGITSQNLPLEVEETVTVRVSNLAPKKLNEYQFSIVYKERTVPALTLPNGLAQSIEKYKASLGQQSAANSGMQDCTELKNAFDALLNTEKETEVKDRIKVLSQKFDALKNQDSCSLLDDSDKTIKVSVDNLIKSTTKDFNVIIREDLGATFSVSDGKDNGVKKIVDINTEGKSKWITTFGLGFYENKNKSYYSKPNENTDNPGFIIQEGNDRADQSYTAQVVFTYPFYQKKGIGVGFSAGVGASQDSIQALVGPGFVFGKNVVLTVGVSMQEVTVLKSQYSVGDDIGSQALDSTALTDKTYKATMMSALTFRF